MERRAKVELFEQIRREYEFGVGTIRGWRAGWAFTGGWCVRRWRMPTAGAQAGRARAASA